MNCSKCKKEMGHYCNSCGYIDEYFESAICKDCYEPLKEKIKTWYQTLAPESKEILSLAEDLGIKDWSWL